MLGSDVEVPVVAVSPPALLKVFFFSFLGWLRRVRGFWYPAVTRSHPAASGRCWTHWRTGCTRLARELCGSCQSAGLYRCSFYLNSAIVDLKSYHTQRCTVLYCALLHRLFWSTFYIWCNHKILFYRHCKGVVLENQICFYFLQLLLIKIYLHYIQFI